MASKPGMPYSDSKIAVYLSKQIDALSGVKSQREIADEIGYEKPNMISMLKRGEAKVPLDKIPLLAKALKVDAAHLFRLALDQYWPDSAGAIAAVFRTPITENEEQIILAIREASHDQNPTPTPEQIEAIKAVFAKN